jgi:hypothetical protein
MMFKIIITTILLGVFTVLHGQNNLPKADDLGRISISSYIPDQIEGLPSSAHANLKNKLNQIATKHALGSNAIQSRFVMTANVVVVSKDITPTAPPMHAYVIEVTLYIGDGVEGTLFSTASITAKGVGETETKAYMSALNALKVSDPKFKDFVEVGSQKIVQYYNSTCDFIIKEAQMLASTNNFDAAIYKLASVPEVCKSCYEKAMDAVQPIFQAQIDRQCNIDLAEAKNIWNVNQNQYGADQAIVYLGRIDPRASCFNEAKTLTAAIGNRIRELEKREWDFKLQQYNNDVELEKATIRAVRDIAVAYAQNQPSVIYNIHGWW